MLSSGIFNYFKKKFNLFFWHKLAPILYNRTMPAPTLPNIPPSPFGVEQKAKAMSQIYLDLDAELRQQLMGATQEAIAGNWNLRRSANLLAQVESKLTDLQVHFQTWEGATLPLAAQWGGDNAQAELKAQAGTYHIQQGDNNTWNRINKEAIDALASDIAGLHAQFLGIIPTPDGKTSILRQADDYLRVLGGKEVARGLGLGLGSDEVARAMRTGAIERLRGGQPLQQMAAGVDKALGMVDRSGREWSLHRYGRMAAQTGMMRSINEGSANKLMQCGQHVYKVSSHGTLCFICKMYEGKVFAFDTEGEAKGYPRLNRDVPFHPHCMHSISPAILEILAPGDSYPTLTKAEINMSDRDRYAWMRDNHPELAQASRQGFSKEAEWERFKKTAKDPEGNPVPLKDLRGSNFRYAGIEKRRLAATEKMLADPNLPYNQAMDVQTRKFMATPNYLKQRTAVTPTQQRAITDAAKKPGGGVVLNRNPYLNGDLPPGGYHPPTLPPPTPHVPAAPVIPAVPLVPASDYMSFKESYLAAKKAMENNLHPSSDEYQAAVKNLFDQKMAFKSQLEGMKMSDLKAIAKEKKIKNWAFASKNDLITLMSEVSPVTLDNVAEALAAKVAGYASNAKHAAAATQAAAKAAEEAAIAAANTAALHAVNSTITKFETIIDLLEYTNNYGQYKLLLDSFKESSNAILNNSIHLTSEQLGDFSNLLLNKKAAYQAKLSAMKVTDLKKFAKDNQIKNWAFASKDDLITLMSETDPAKIETVTNGLAAKVAGYSDNAKAAAKAKTAAAPVNVSVDPNPVISINVPGYTPVVPTPTSAVLSSTVADFKALDEAWIANVKPNPDDWFDLVGDARSLGGAHEKYIYSDINGDRWLFKPVDRDFLSLADEMTYKVSRLLDPDAVEIREITLGGKLGSIQRMKMGLKDKINYYDIDLADIPVEEIKQIQQHHVVDWLISNHDGHAGNFLRMANGRVVEIDLAQTFKFFPNDKLDITYRANHSQTLHNELFAAVKRGTIKVDPLETLKAIEKIEAVSDEQYLNLISDFAKSKYRSGSELNTFYEQALDRKNGLRTDFEKFYKDVLNDEDFTFESLKKVKTAKVAKAAPDNIWDPYISDIKKLGSQGKSIPFDTNVVEDQDLLIYTEFTKGTARTRKPTTVFDLKIRPDHDRGLMDFMQRNMAGETFAGGALPGDVFYEDIMYAVRHFNANREEQRFNTTRFDEAFRHRSALSQIVRSGLPGDDNLVKMAKEYLEVIDELSHRISIASKDRMPNFIQYEGRAVYSGGGRYQVKQSKFTLDEKKSENGQSYVKTEGVTIRKILRHASGGESAAEGWQYSIDMGDGVSVVYKPWVSDNMDRSRMYALSGKFEMRVEGEISHDIMQKALAKMDEMGIPAVHASMEDMELQYLHKQAYLTKDHIETAYVQMMARLEARGATNSEMIDEMRGYWNSKLGVADVTKLPDYNPAGQYKYGHLDPRVGGGHREFIRFDMPDDQFDYEMAGYSLYHSATDESDLAELVDMILKNNGNFVSTVEKMRIGVPVGGMSPVPDCGTGGASYFFTRIRKFGMPAEASKGFYFKKKLLKRMDAISYEGDEFGRCTEDFVTRKRRSDYAGWNDCAADAGHNETIFKHSVSMVDNIDKIKASSQEAKEEIIAVFKKYGIEKLPDGRWVKDIVKCPTDRR
jgi:hypothetical protein